MPPYQQNLLSLSYQNHKELQKHQYHMYQRINDQHLAAFIQQIFHNYDGDHSGTLQSTELHLFFNDLYRSMGHTRSVTPQQALQALALIDKDHNGRVSKAELFQAFKQVFIKQGLYVGNQQIYQNTGYNFHQALDSWKNDQQYGANLPNLGLSSYHSELNGLSFNYQTPALVHHAQSSPASMNSQLNNNLLMSQQIYQNMSLQNNMRANTNSYGMGSNSMNMGMDNQMVGSAVQQNYPNMDPYIMQQMILLQNQLNAQNFKNLALQKQASLQVQQSQLMNKLQAQYCQNGAQIQIQMQQAKKQQMMAQQQQQLLAAQQSMLLQQQQQLYQNSQNQFQHY